jgi:hypothetical protein
MSQNLISFPQPDENDAKIFSPFKDQGVQFRKACFITGKQYVDAIFISFIAARQVYFFLAV